MVVQIKIQPGEVTEVTETALCRSGERQLCDTIFS